MGMIWASLLVEKPPLVSKMKRSNGAKVRSECSDWVRPIGVGWLGVLDTKMERATGIEEASDSESGSGSEEAWVSKSFTNWKSKNVMDNSFSFSRNNCYSAWCVLESFWNADDFIIHKSFVLL